LSQRVSHYAAEDQKAILFHMMTLLLGPPGCGNYTVTGAVRETEPIYDGYGRNIIQQLQSSN
ncbi:hypothetical protein FRX31_005352, partial [Thalictrum thalictroides]